MKLHPGLTSLTKINSNWIKDLNITPDNHKALRRTHRVSNLLDISLSSDLKNLIPKAKATK